MTAGARNNCANTAPNNGPSLVYRPRMRTQAQNHGTADHDQLQSDDARWNELTFVGIQDCFGLREPDDIIELRNCTCGSTLGRYGKRSKFRDDEISVDHARSLESL